LVTLKEKEFADHGCEMNENLNEIMT